MILSCLPVSYFPELFEGRKSITDWAIEAKDLRLDAIDMSVVALRRYSAGELDRISQQVGKIGLSIMVITMYTDFTAPDSEKRNEELRLFEKDIELIHHLGARMARVTAGQQYPGLKRNQGIEWAVSGLKAAAEMAGKWGIELLFENHSKPGVWEFWDFAHPHDIFLEIVERLPPSAFGILFDTANPLATGEDGLSLLRRVVQRVRCVHASDTKTRGSLQPTVVGTGLVPFDELFGYLRKISYDGVISIEEASKTGTSGVRQAVEFVRRAWNTSLR